VGRKGTGKQRGNEENHEHTNLNARDNHQSRLWKGRGVYDKDRRSKATASKKKEFYLS